jgi:hypothetical protein
MFAPAIVLPAAVSLSVGRSRTNYPLAVGDFDGDGNPDIALAEAGNAEMGVFFGNGDGSFLPIAQYPNVAPQSIWPITLGDGGNVSILAVAEDNGSMASVAVATLQGDGSERVVASVPMTFDNGLEGFASVADLNGDGVADFVVFAVNDVGVGVGFALQVSLANDSGGWTNTNFLAQCVWNDHFIADFNEDGVPDLIAEPCMGSPGPRPLHLFLGRGDGTFDDHGVIDAQGEDSASDFAFLIGDLNGDGHLDLLIEAIRPASGIGTGAWAVALGRGDGSFLTGSSVDLGQSQPYALHDLDGDGHLDYVGTVVDADSGAAVRFAMGNGDGTFQAWTDLPMDAGVSEVVVGDVNNDGRPDLIASDRLSQSVGVFLNCR